MPPLFGLRCSVRLRVTIGQVPSYLLPPQSPEKSGILRVTAQTARGEFRLILLLCDCLARSGIDTHRGSYGA